MRVLLRPVLVPELGLVIVKPGREPMPVFHNTRLLVEPEPKSMRNLPSGVVPAARQPLVEDKTLLPFFSNARVIRAAGGAGALSDWLLRHIKSCQWPHGVARRFFLHQNAINFALPEGAKKTHSAQCKNERKECLLMLLLSRITLVESRQTDSIFESYISM